MKTYLQKLIKNKRILILGFGREGKSTLKALLEAGGYERLAVSDLRPVMGELPKEITLICGEGYLDCLDDFDIVFKSPGVVLPKNVSEYSSEILSQTEVFIRCFREKIIGITGTKGKSTTSSLMYHVLKNCGKKALFAGNIGIPVFDIANEVEEDSVIVIELSCHQLEYALTSPKRAVILNLYEDHLDHYGTRDKYIAAKRNIYLHQQPGDTFYTTKEAYSEMDNIPANVKLIGKEDAPVSSFEDVPGCLLKGVHNLINAAFVYTVCKEFGISKESFIDALETFMPLKHRLELAVKKNGVDYYDDSISTTVKSTINGVESIKNASILLMGGMERNIEYEELAKYLVNSRLKYVVCMYESGKRFYHMYCEESKDRTVNTEAVLVNDLAEAVDFAVSHAKEGEAVLLSPAAASYGYFKNFEERGDCFVSLVKNK